MAAALERKQHVARRLYLPGGFLLLFDLGHLVFVRAEALSLCTR